MYLSSQVKKNPVQDKSLMPGDYFILLPEPETEVDISSGDTMNITISKSCLNVFSNLAKVCLVLAWTISQFGSCLDYFKWNFKWKRMHYFCLSSTFISKKCVAEIQFLKKILNFAKILLCCCCVPFQGFSEGTASTFDCSLKDRAPFTVTNSVGVPIKVQPNHNLRVMGSLEKSDVCDVDAGQKLELEYASMEPSCQGKLSTLSRQESSLFSLTFGMLYLCYF